MNNIIKFLKSVSVIDTETTSINTKIAEIVMKEMNKKVDIKWSGESWPGDDNRILIKPDIMVNKTSQEAIELAVK
jgi:hypothetical protein